MALLAVGAIGLGASVGPEAGVTQPVAAASSWLGRRFRLSRALMRLAASFGRDFAAKTPQSGVTGSADKVARSAQEIPRPDVQRSVGQGVHVIAGPPAAPPAASANIR
jgi:hypothetical protein